MREAEAGIYAIKRGIENKLSISIVSDHARGMLPD